MRLLPNKTFPHPILWGYADDYCRRQFQAVREFSVRDDGVPVLSFNFALNEESIIGLLDGDQAAYALEVYCPTTFVRSVFYTHKKAGQFSLQKGDLYRRVEVNAFIICTKSVKKYSSANFNEEFGDSSYDLLPGDVVAAAETEIYYWDTASVAPLHSVFQLVANDSLKAGMFAVDAGRDIIEIQMSSRDANRFHHMRQSKEQKSMTMFVYFSVVAEVLRQMKESNEDEDKKWYHVMQHKLEEIGKDITSESADPFVLAQELLRGPLGYLLPKLDSGN